MAAVDVQATRSAMTAPPAPRRQPVELPEGFWYSVKRRLGHAAAALAAAEAAAPGTHVTVVLPRRSYPPLARRLLHDHAADRIARQVSRVRGAAATIVPFDVRHKVETIQARRHRAGVRDRRLDRRADRRILRPHAHPWPGARRAGPAARHGRRRERRPPCDDQSRVRPARLAAAILPSRRHGRPITLRCIVTGRT